MTHTVKDIAGMLAARAEDVCRHLLPGGKKNGGEWEAGSVGGEKGKSCKVRLNGDKAGLWCDFATGSDAGDLLDLWALARNVKLADAIKEAKEFLNIREPKFEPPRKQYAKPTKKDARPLAGRALEYLKNERKLTQETLTAFKVAESAGGEEIVLPFIGPKGELNNIKRLAVNRDEHGKKIIRTEKDCAPSLFGWQASTGARIATICEGEIDAMTLAQYGVENPLSVPFGAGIGSKNDWIDFEWDNLAQFETIFLCYDNDEAGQSCVSEVARRLGIHRCRVVTLPKKDANECLQAGVTGEEIARCFNAAKTFDPPEIRAPIDFKSRVVEYFYPTTESANGFMPALFDRNICFRPGELTIWTGCNSHGKSVLVGQIILAAMISKGLRAAIASMEMKPEQTLGRMLRQLYVVRVPSANEISAGLSFFSGRLWIYDLMGNVKTEKLLGLIEFSMRRHRVDHFVIDSLMKCDVGGEDYDGQRRFLNDAVTFAKTHNCHIHLIAHPRKHDEEKPVGRVAISGSGDISNQADNVISVWRNKAKERGAQGKELYSEADAIVLCDKQRESGWEGSINLCFQKLCDQFYSGRFGTVDFWRYANLTKDEQESASPVQD